MPRPVQNTPQVFRPRLAVLADRVDINQRLYRSPQLQDRKCVLVIHPLVDCFIDVQRVDVFLSERPQHAVRHRTRLGLDGGISAGVDEKTPVVQGRLAKRLATGAARLHLRRAHVRTVRKINDTPVHVVPLGQAIRPRPRSGRCHCCR